MMWGISLCVYLPLLLFIVRSPSHVWLFATPWTAAHQASLSFTISWSLLKLMSVESVMPSNVCCPFFLLASVFPSIKVFSSESAFRMRWPKYWSISISICHWCTLLKYLLKLLPIFIGNVYFLSNWVVRFYYSGCKSFKHVLEKLFSCLSHIF